MSSIEKKIQESAARRGLILNRDDIACVMDICTRNEVLRVEERISLTKESVDAKTNAKTQTKGKICETKSTKMKTKRTIVFIHGMFGWGYNTEDSARKDEEEGEVSYFPVGDIRRVCGESSCVYLDVGIASSDHDRACEAYAQIMGRTVDYGEEHAKRCGHLRFGRKYTKPLVKIWDENHPIVLVGHSFGGNTCLELAHLISQDYWSEGTSSSYIHSVSCICSPLRGCSLPFRLGLNSTTSSKSVIRNFSFSHFLSTAFGLIFKIQLEYPSLFPRSVFDIKSDQWANVTTWRNVFDRDHVFWTSRDNTLSQVTPSYRRDLQSRRKRYDWHKIAVVPDVVKPLSLRREVVPFGCFAILALWILRRRRRLKHFLVATILLAMTGLIAIGKRVRRRLFHKCLVHPFLRLCAMGCDGPSDGIVEISSCKSTHNDEKEWYVIRGPKGSSHCLGTWASIHSGKMYAELLKYLCNL